MLDFKKITLEDKEIIDDFLKNDNELSCENTFVNLLVWQNVYNYRYAIEDNLLFLVSSERTTFSPSSLKAFAKLSQFITPSNGNL